MALKAQPTFEGRDEKTTTPLEQTTEKAAEAPLDEAKAETAAANKETQPEPAASEVTAHEDDGA